MSYQTATNTGYLNPPTGQHKDSNTCVNYTQTDTHLNSVGTCTMLECLSGQAERKICFVFCHILETCLTPSVTV